MDAEHFGRPAHLDLEALEKSPSHAYIPTDEVAAIHLPGERQIAWLIAKDAVANVAADQQETINSSKQNTMPMILT